MIDPKASKQPKPNTFVDLKRSFGRMAIMPDTICSQEMIERGRMGV